MLKLPATVFVEKFLNVHEKKKKNREKFLLLKIELTQKTTRYKYSISDIQIN